MQTSIVTIIFAVAAIVALVGVAFWLVHRFGTNRLGAGTQRGRMPRLAVIDAAAVDGRRRLVLVRRDNVEHLLMIGGPNDMIVEPNIVRATPAREQMPQRPGTAAEPPPRVAPLPESIGWSDTDTSRAESLEPAEPQMPEPPPRPARPSFADEMRRPAPPLPERRPAPIPDFAAEPIAPRPEPRLEPRAESRQEPRMPRQEPMIARPPRPGEPPKAPPRLPERAIVPPPPPPPAAPPPPAPPVSSADQNLAEMAQRLEAALRRPATEMAPPVAPEPPAAPPAPPPPRPARSEPPAQAKSGFDKSTFENLEDEMASLLGRPKPPSSS
jgi:hypothetical protein